MLIDPFDNQSPCFKCSKCGLENEYTEFAPAPNPKTDYGYYVIEGDIEPCGINIVGDINLCVYCARMINVGGKND